jgi:hypothetical protein
VKKKAFYVFAVVVLSLGWWQSAGFWLRSRGPDRLVALPIVAWLFASALALVAASVRYSGWLYAGLLVLAVSSLPLLSLLSGIFADQQSPSWGYAASLMVPPVALLIVLFLCSGLTAQARRTTGALEGDVTRAERQQAERAASILVLSALTLLCWEVAASIFGYGFFPLNPLSWLITLAFVVLLVSAMALGARRVGDGAWILVALLLLLGLSLPASVVNDIFTASPEPPLALILMPSVALLVTTLLLHSGLSAYKERQQASAVEDGRSQTQHKRAGRAAAVVLVVGAGLLAKTLHHLYWFTVWDNTYDSLGYLLLLVPVPVALLSGATLSSTLSGGMKWTGFLYALLISGLMIEVSARAQQVDFRQLTEERAARVTQAIESYYAREGRYPQDLGELTPRYALWLPCPFIIPGQDWCYDGGDGYYRLGYVDREHWSDPRLIGRIYRTKGDVPDLHGMCEEDVAAIQRRYPNYPYKYCDLCN